MYNNNNNYRDDDHDDVDDPSMSHIFQVAGLRTRQQQSIAYTWSFAWLRPEFVFIFKFNEHYNALNAIPCHLSRFIPAHIFFFCFFFCYEFRNGKWSFNGRPTHFDFTFGWLTERRRYYENYLWNISLDRAAYMSFHLAAVFVRLQVFFSLHTTLATRMRASLEPHNWDRKAAFFALLLFGRCCFFFFVSIPLQNRWLFMLF